MVTKPLYDKMDKNNEMKKEKKKIIKKLLT
jgi:hypothetical protein